MSARLVVAVLMFWAGLCHAQVADDHEGGIIGTGIHGFGIVGTITALGSIYVNDQHILLDHDLAVQDGITATWAGQLLPGHTVAVVAEPAGDDWQARHIRQILPLVGPVTAVDDASITVLGSRVDTYATRGEPIEIGDWVGISGLWQGGRIIASKIEQLAADQRVAQISGTYLGPGENGQLQIGTTGLSGIVPQHLEIGDLLRASGAPVKDGLLANSIETGLFTQPTTLIQIEGYFSEPQPDGLYTLLGSGLIAYTDFPEMISTVVPVVQCGVAGELATILDENRLGC